MDEVKKYYVYILKCSDGSLYAGATQNLAKRLHEHNDLKSGAKYTKARRPVTLVYSQECDSFAHSRAREAEIKRMTRIDKLLLLKGHLGDEKK